eukprot:SAG11_NODE_5815_length_1457_cov_50.243004_2_plen_399_part_00
MIALVTARIQFEPNKKITLRELWIALEASGEQVMTDIQQAREQYRNNGECVDNQVDLAKRVEPLVGSNCTAIQVATDILQDFGSGTVDRLPQDIFAALVVGVVEESRCRGRTLRAMIEGVNADPQQLKANPRQPQSNEKPIKKGKQHAEILLEMIDEFKLLTGYTDARVTDVVNRAGQQFVALGHSVLLLEAKAGVLDEAEPCLDSNCYGNTENEAKRESAAVLFQYLVRKHLSITRARRAKARMRKWQSNWNARKMTLRMKQKMEARAMAAECRRAKAKEAAGKLASAEYARKSENNSKGRTLRTRAQGGADGEYEATRESASETAHFHSQKRPMSGPDRKDCKSPRQIGRFNRLEGENALTLVWTNHLGGSLHALRTPCTFLTLHRGLTRPRTRRS